MPSRIEITAQDITQINVDAIVTPTNMGLKPETSQEMAIHAVAGPKLAAECAHVVPCPVSEARITRGYDLPSNFVIHAVDPVWGGGESGEDELLSTCYKNIFELVTSFEIKTIAISPLSSGEKGFPPLRSAHIAMQQIIAFLERNKTIERVIICGPDSSHIQTYEAAFDKCATEQTN